MRRILILGVVILSISACRAQVMPVENVVNYVNSENGIPDNVNQIKDVNNVLDKYVGTWSGSYKGRNYRFVVNKFTDVRERLSEEMLVMRYKIVEVRNGQITSENTLDLPSSSPYVIRGDYLAKTGSYYVLNYIGKEAKCNQSGDVFISIYNNGTQMKLFLEPENEMMLAKDCPDGPADQIMPTEEITLTRQ